MGFRDSWIAARGIDREALLFQLGLEAEEPVEYPDTDARICVVDGPGGWIQVYFVGNSGGVEERLPNGPVGASVDWVCCWFSETVMWSSATRGLGSDVMWEVEYADEGLAVTGTLDAEQRAICEEQRRKNEADSADHLFEIPRRLADHAVGFEDADGWIRCRVVREPSRMSGRKGCAAGLALLLALLTISACALTP